ncbi:MAG TPA: peptidoglycan-binding domain-containing protein, partial [Oscillatoriaceae cyanobacterium]
MPRLKVWGAIALLSLTTLVPPSLAATKKPVAHATRRHAKLPPGILFDCRFVKGNWKLNGLYGPFTRDAVQAFQRANHLFPDGVAGLKTDHALGLKFTRKLRCGMGGHDVYLLQKALLAHGYWYGQHGRPAPTPTPIPSPPLAPSPSVPTSGWQKPPILYTPAPLPTPEPTVPTPKPAPSATPRPLVLAPAPKAVPAPAASPVATIAIGAWAADGLSSLRTAPISLEGEGAVNLGAFELRGDAVAISAPNAPGVT